MLLPDRREDYCYFELTGRRCVQTAGLARTTQAGCCCLGGAAWGRRCERCPTVGSGRKQLALSFSSNLRMYVLCLPMCMHIYE